MDFAWSITATEDDIDELGHVNNCLLYTSRCV